MGPKKRPKTILESRIERVEREEREKRNVDAGNEDYGDPMEIYVPKEKDVPKVYLPNTDKVGPVQSSFSPHSTASSATASPTHKNLPPIAVPSPQLTSNGKPIEHSTTPPSSPIDQNSADFPITSTKTNAVKPTVHAPSTASSPRLPHSRASYSSYENPTQPQMPSALPIKGSRQPPNPNLLVVQVRGHERGFWVFRRKGTPEHPIFDLRPGREFPSGYAEALSKDPKYKPKTPPNADGKFLGRVETGVCTFYLIENQSHLYVLSKTEVLKYITKTPWRNKNEKLKQINAQTDEMLNKSLEYFNIGEKRVPMGKERVASIIEIHNLLQEVAQLFDQRQKKRIVTQPTEDMEETIRTSVCSFDSDDGRDV